MANIFPARPYCLNGSSRNMVVDGSVTPVAFTIAPAAGTVLNMDELILNAVGTGTISLPTEFWSFAGLTNGIGSEMRINGVTITQAGLIKNNFDLFQFIGADFVGKTLGSRNIVRGGFNISPPFSLNGNRGDYFKLTINDNLTTAGVIENFNVSLRGNVIIL